MVVVGLVLALMGAVLMVGRYDHRWSINEWVGSLFIFVGIVLLVLGLNATPQWLIGAVLAGIFTPYLTWRYIMPKIVPNAPEK